MTKRKEYAVEVYGPPEITWVATASDDDDDNAAPVLTTDPQLAARYVKFTDARGACRDAVKWFPQHSFRVGLID